MTNSELDSTDTAVDELDASADELDADILDEDEAEAVELDADGAGSGGDDSADGDGDEAPGRSGSSLLVQEGDIAADYLERLLDIVDYDGDIDLDVENDRAVVAIVGSDLGNLVGSDGATLEALQELTRLAVQQKTGSRSRLMLDISNFRAQRRISLQELATQTAETVLADQEPARLAPMNPFERKVVHDMISGIDGVRSESEGEEPNRRVLVLLDD
jgi:spoIIIJ-associated protein